MNSSSRFHSMLAIANMHVSKHACSLCLFLNRILFTFDFFFLSLYLHNSFVHQNTHLCGTDSLTHIAIIQEVFCIGIKIPSEYLIILFSHCCWCYCFYFLFFLHIVDGKYCVHAHTVELMHSLHIVHLFTSCLFLACFNTSIYKKRSA